LIVASQAIDLVRQAVAHTLNLKGGDVTVKSRRAGGSYGGKITGNTGVSAAVAVAASKLDRPVKLQNNIYTDHRMTGGRHPVLANYTVGFDEEGVITALSIDAYLDGGAIHDATFDTLSEFALSVDGCYAIPNWRCTSTAVFTHTQPNCSIRGPGQVPGAMVAERIIERVASECKLDPRVVRERNFYTKRNCITPFGQPMLASFSLPNVWQKCLSSIDLESRLKDVENFNKNNRWRKRAISVCPVKYSTFNWPSSSTFSPFFLLMFERKNISPIPHPSLSLSLFLTYTRIHTRNRRTSSGECRRFRICTTRICRDRAGYTHSCSASLCVHVGMPVGMHTNSGFVYRCYA